jgi:hypothetical protein
VHNALDHGQGSRSEHGAVDETPEYCSECEAIHVGFVPSLWVAGVCCCGGVCCGVARSRVWSAVRLPAWVYPCVLQHLLHGAGDDSSLVVFAAPGLSWSSSNHMTVCAHRMSTPPQFCLLSLLIFLVCFVCFLPLLNPQRSVLNSQLLIPSAFRRVLEQLQQLHSAK